MDIQSTKLELLKTIMDSEDDEFIQKVADFVEKEKVTFGTNWILPNKKRLNKQLRN